MNTPATTIAGGFFAQLMPMLADRTVMMIVSKADEQHLTVSVIPKRMKDSENAALATPLCCTGTPEELDRELPTQVREFVAGHVALCANLAEIQREREDAEKAARDELKKKQKTIGNGGARNTPSEPKPKEAGGSTAPDFHRRRRCRMTEKLSAPALIPNGFSITLARTLTPYRRGVRRRSWDQAARRASQ
jgi:PRTRC genetic system protein E